MSEIPQLNDRAEISIKSPQFRQPVFSARQQEIHNKHGVVNTSPTLSSKPAPARPAETAKPVAPIATSPEQLNLVQEIKSMRSMLQEQFACMTWSDLQLRDPNAHACCVIW
jgi:hypothetical protein